MADPENDSSCIKGVEYFEQFNQVFNSEKIDEVDVIPCVQAEHVSCPIIVDGRKIGIRSCCVKAFFCFAYKELVKLKTNKKNILEEGNYVMELSRIILLLHAEDYTVWNMRKRCVLAGKQFRDDELDFCTLVLTKHPRSSESFAHRRWLLSYLSTENVENLKTSKFLSKELCICSLCAEKYRDNYTAWSQRCWLVNNFMSNSVEQLLEEFHRIEEWVWMHVSDHCGFHFRQYLLEKLGKSCPKKMVEKLVMKEFELTDEMLKRYPGHETVWYHRRFIMNYWFSMFPPCRNCISHWQNYKTGCNPRKNEETDSPLVRERHSRDPVCWYCTSSQTQSSVVISPSNEMRLCQTFLTMSNNDPPELKRQADLAASHYQWIGIFSKTKIYAFQIANK